MKRVNLKPLTVNMAWRGRRYKTAEYDQYEKDLSYLLPKIEIPEGKLEVVYTFGVSNKLADWDNCIKQFQDIISKKYGFNDNRIYKAQVNKVITKKGEEFIGFEVNSLN